MSEPNASPGYEGQRIALLTRHGKEQVIAPRFAAALGARVERVDGYDTDRLGTFTREIPREGTQIEAARRKARIGMMLSGLPFGLASEGSFGVDPYAGMFGWNVELVMLIDDVRQIEIVGRWQGPARHQHALIGTREELEAFASVAEFPSHALVVRPECEDDPRIRKGVADWPQLYAIFDRARQESSTGKVFVESDLRAHANPSRMQSIAAATDDLIRRIASRCPACATAGFWVVERIPGLPCADCRTPTGETRAERYGCIKCDYRELHGRAGVAEADPARCPACNP